MEFPEINHQLFLDVLNNKESEIERDEFMYCPYPEEIGYDWDIRDARGGGR